MTAIDWGSPFEEMASKPPEVSKKAREQAQIGDGGLF
jgi:hypothetical protein